MQDIEPRRWSNLPLGSNFGCSAYAYTEGDIFFNPVLRIEDGEFEMNTAAFKDIHAFELLGKSARIDPVQLVNGAFLPRDFRHRQRRVFQRQETRRGSRWIGQSHLIHTVMPGLWLGASAGISVSRNFGFKIAYIGIRTQDDTGSDNDTFTSACPLQW